MAIPRRRFTRRVLPALLIIAILGLGARVGGGGDGGGYGAGVASAREDLTRLDEDWISVGTTPSSPRVRAGLRDGTAIVDGTDPSPPPIPPRAASKPPPPARKESAGGAWNLGTESRGTRAETTKSKSTELVAGIAALEVDHSTHAADDEAARAIANAGKQTSGYADALDTSKIVFATFVSNGFHEFMLNWFEHTKRLGVDNVIVAALDEETEALCVANGIPYHSDKDLRYTFEVMATGGQPLHDPNAKVTMEGKAFQQIGALKAAFLLFLLNRGHRVLVSDVDTVWLNDPREWFERDDLPTRTDVSVSTDCLSHEEERRSRGCWGPGFNTGILWLRPTAPTIAMMATWRDALLTTSDKFEHDQDIFNKLLRVEDDGSPASFAAVDPPLGVRSTRSSFAEADGDGRVGEALHMRRVARGIVLGALPLARFCSGQVYFVQRLPQRLGVKPLVVHTTYQFSQARGKRQRLREAGLWLLDDDAYYGRGPGFVKKGFIAMLPDDQPPAELIADGAGVEKHLAAAAWYRLAIRNLVAAAEATGRVPVLPRITCVCDRWWGDVLPSCKIPGSDVSPPFDTCPQDHIMNLPNMERAGVEWREWSFLDRVGEDARGSAALARLGGGADTRGGADTIGGAVGRVFDLPAYPTDAEWAAATADVDEKIVYVSSGVGSFCTFADATDAVAFDRKMAVALQAESHFCESVVESGGGGAAPRRACHVGFDVPRGVATDRNCDAMREEAGDPRSFEARFDRRSPVGGEKRAPA